MLNKMIKLSDSLYAKFEEIFKSSDEQQLLKILFKMLMIAAFAAVTLFVLNLFLVNFTETSGVFGDFFGGVLNPILTFLTFFGLIATIVIQKQELKSARVEYERTANALSTQAIENTFFNILSLHHNIADNLIVDLDEIKEVNPLGTKLKSLISSVMFLPSTNTKTVFEGRSAFEAIFEHLTENNDQTDGAIARYKFMQDQYNHVLGHYFRNLYQALKAIHSYDASQLDPEKKQKYASILRAQLSTTELALLFLNCVNGVSDRGQFRNLLVAYAMLEHLPFDETPNGYIIAHRLNISRFVFEQFLEQRDIHTLDLHKKYGGAYGANGGRLLTLATHKTEDTQP